MCSRQSRPDSSVGKEAGKCNGAVVFCVFAAAGEAARDEAAACVVMVASGQPVGQGRNAEPAERPAASTGGGLLAP